MARKSLKKKGGPIATGKFSMDDSKMYVAIGLICFHILPLFFVFMGQAGQTILMTVFLTTLNPILIFCICCFHACRLGFCVKFPLIMGVVSSLSILMYYNGIAEGMGLITCVLFLIVYMIFSFGSEAVGGFIKKLMGG
ncbi:MAG: hypothetical protein Q4G33_14910 [bacterium]|nr:hypothetical protein [bacterium]